MQQNNTVYDDTQATKKSSNVQYVEYDPDMKTLDVTFKDGRMYRYADVPQEIVTGLVSAKSVGGFIYSTIRDHYQTEEV